MSIIDSSNERIHLLNEKKEEILSLKDKIPDAPYHVFNINAMIRDAEMRLDRLKTSYAASRCTECDQIVPDEENPTVLGRRVFCNRCLHTISQVITTTEMEERGDMKEGTVKIDCNQSLQFLRSTPLIRKSGKCWLVHESLLDLFYANNRNKEYLENSWIDSMEQQLVLLRKQHQIMTELKDLLSGATWQLFSLEAQIRDYESRINFVKGGTHPFRCSQCNGWIKESGLPILVGHFTLCRHCKRTIEQVITTSEAESRYNIVPGKIRKHIHSGRLDKYLKIGLIRQSGSIWLLHEAVIQHNYFPEERPAPTQAKIPDSLLARSKAIYQNT